MEWIFIPFPESVYVVVGLKLWYEVFFLPLRNIPKIRKRNVLINRPNNSDFKLGIFCFSYSISIYFCGNKIKKNHLTSDVVSDFSENSTLNFLLFYQKIINTISPDFFCILLFLMEHPLTSNVTMYMINEISYIWRSKISASCWSPVTRSQSLTLVDVRNPKFLDEVQEPELVERTVRLLNITEGLLWT